MEDPKVTASKPLPRHKRPKISQQGDLDLHFLNHMEFLRVSAEAYDGGRWPEAKRLAASLRVLLYDRGLSKSLMGQLGRLNDRSWLDTAGQLDEAASQGQHRLASVRQVHGYHQWVPFLEFFPRDLALLGGRARGSFIDFETWWDVSAVIKDQRGERFTRKDLVLAVANSDGGAHVDPGIPDHEYYLSRLDSLGSFVGIAPAPYQDNPILAAVRQIAFEVLASDSRLTDPAFMIRNSCTP